MKFGQSLAVSLAALLCTGSLALAQAPDKGGMGGGMGGMGGGAPAEKMDRGGGGPGAAQDGRQPSRGMTGERGGAERGMSERGQAGERSSRSARPEAQGRERDQDRAQRPGRDKDQDRAQRPGGDKDQDRAQRRDKDEDRAQRAGRDRDQDKTQRTARDKEQQRARDRDQDRAAKSGRDRDQERAQRSDRDRDQGKAAQGRTPDRNGQLQQANRVQASEKQHTEVRQHLLRDRKVGRTRLNIAVNIGATIPRSVRLHPVSSVIVGLAPVYRGYSYIVLEDETICIVDPRSYVIVDVIPASTQRAEGPGGHLTLSAEERRLVLANVDKDRAADINVRLALGAEIPRSVEVVIFPDRVLERVPQLRAYRYVVVEDQVVIVDPDDRQVALVLND
jgi:Protein of unknown function (DUF1236)